MEPTERQLEALQLKAEGLSHEDIGLELGITSNTVDKLIQHASRRLGADNSYQAIAMAFRRKLLE